MRETLAKQYAKKLKHLTREGTTDNAAYKEILHTEMILASAITRQRDKKVINRPAPTIDKSEKTLPQGYIFYLILWLGGGMMPGKKMKNEVVRNKMKKKEKGKG